MTLMTHSVTVRAASTGISRKAWSYERSTQRETFVTSRQLDFFSKKELTAHERWRRSYPGYSIAEESESRAFGRHGTRQSKQRRSRNEYHMIFGERLCGILSGRASPDLWQ